MNLIKKIISRHKRDGLFIFIKNCILHYPRIYFLNNRRIKRAYSLYLKNEYSFGELDALQKEIDNSQLKPLISVVMPTYKSNLFFLKLAVDSVIKQTYSNWELCIVDDASNDPKLTEYLTQLSLEDHRIKCYFSKNNQHISGTSNKALSMCSGIFVALLDHDDELSPYALAYLAREIIKNPSVQVIYSDEDKINSSGKRYEPYFKCDWNYELFLGQNMISHLGAYNTELLRSIGGFRKGFEGSQDYDLALRCIEKIAPAQITHIPKVLYHWRVLPGSTALNINEKPYAILAAEKALNEHLIRIGKKGEAEYIHFGYRIKYEFTPSKEVVDVFIAHCEADELSLLNLCRRLSKNPCINKVFVSSRSTKFDSLISNVTKVRRIERKFNSNFQAQLDCFQKMHAAEFAIFINEYALIDDLDNRWLIELLSQMNNLDATLVAGSAFNGSNYLISGPQYINKSRTQISLFSDHHESNGGYFGRMQLTQRLSSVDTDCLLANSNALDKTLNQLDIGSMNSTAELFKQLASNGQKVVWTPFSRIRLSKFKPKKLESTSSYHQSIKFNDPYYSPNFLDGNSSFIINPNPNIET
jgi:glycosyltransferase involved in cell wall biosynthesis